MSTEKQCRKEKNQNIQVFVRLRPLNQRERDLKSLGVVEVVHNREVVVRQSQQTSITKKFTFDKAFGPDAKQLEVYQEVVSPLIREVLAGYNCTVFAYGQTGTGKTHTMIGENTGDETNWQKDPLAGIVPRALGQLFDELRLTNTEYTIRVSYLELYNEELFDLLSTSEDNSKLRIYEDVTRKGANIVNGLEEITVHSKQQVYEIMDRGQERKRVASTLMNAQSSRSHTVFTIVVHMKENSPEGEELMKIGKLNLVDLAGSENISKAGSDNPAKRERARECVNINQSLLTLGRVITALVERHPHVPYRESKLTRILQESLGGRTKTSIIATISPGHKDLEETLSTLEYAHRAKNIQNKPEVNQKLTKKAILKEYVDEIDKLKRDLQASRDKNGVYLANETFAEMTLKQEEQRKEIQELLLRKKALEEEKDKMEVIFQELNKKLDKRNSELNRTKNKLNSTKEKLISTNCTLQSTKRQYEEQCHLVTKHCETEGTLGTQAKEILAAADLAVTDVARLHDNVSRRKKVESSNLEITKTYCEESSQQRELIVSHAKRFKQDITHNVDTLHTGIESHAANSKQTLSSNKRIMETLAQKTCELVNEVRAIMSTSLGQVTESSATQRESVSRALAARQTAIRLAADAVLRDMAASEQRAQQLYDNSNVAAFVQQWLTGASARINSLQTAHAAFATRAQHSQRQRGESAHRQRETRQTHLDRRAASIKSFIAEMEVVKEQIENRITEQISDMESERRETEERLNNFIEEERRSLEERLNKYAETEKGALEKRMEKKMAEIQQTRLALEDTLRKLMELQQMQLAANEEEMEVADRDLVEIQKDIEDSQSYCKKYGKEFDEGTSAISIDMEAFSRNVVEVVDHVNNQLMDVIKGAKEHVESNTNTMMMSETESNSRLANESDAIFTAMVENSNNAMECVFNMIETNNASTIRELSQLSATTADVVSSTDDCVSSHGEIVSSMKNIICTYENELTEAVSKQANIENLYLSNEYKVYSPTGNTPTRVEYRYPRVLAATSPHERLLAKFRAMRQQNDEDCILIESDTESRFPSDSESSVSEDSAVFAVPSPPLSDDAGKRLHNRTAVDHISTPVHIVKSTSETDLYAIRKKQENGKENNTDSSFQKKRSKLPAPMTMSHKKPLMERNETVN
ncbi:hypothetical protein K1T71_012009 [Dendrolimus kikuchii]|uniref:Uncharacterized protein n=1 Tax=Dendrolimus kikuchii TaxID=765133 RepID=A0ACC1CKC4_9NEOP|nr:hypothetical protein K1T71_012009 [Dendrolimus kikuchii]